MTGCLLQPAVMPVPAMSTEYNYPDEESRPPVRERDSVFDAPSAARLSANDDNYSCETARNTGSTANRHDYGLSGVRVVVKCAGWIGNQPGRGAGSSSRHRQIQQYVILRKDGLVAWIPVLRSCFVLPGDASTGKNEGAGSTRYHRCMSNGPGRILTVNSSLQDFVWTNQ